MVRLDVVVRYLPAVAVIGLVVYCVIDCVQTPTAQVRGLPKPLWLVLIVLTTIIGSVGWLLGGRPQQPTRARGGAVPDAAGGTPPRALGPDDDPDFLRSLKRSNDEHERLLESWEDDLRRREGETGDGTAGAADARAAAGVAAGVAALKAAPTRAASRTASPTAVPTRGVRTPAAPPRANRTRAAPSRRAATSRRGELRCDASVLTASAAPSA
jgi:hypothetical protein